MSKTHTPIKGISDADQIPIDDKSERNFVSKDEILCDSLAYEIQKILSNISPDQAAHVWHLVGVYLYQQIDSLQLRLFFDRLSTAIIDRLIPPYYHYQNRLNLCLMSTATSLNLLVSC